MGVPQVHYDPESGTEAGPAQNVVEQTDVFTGTGSGNLQRLHHVADQTGSLKQRVTAIGEDVDTLHKLAIAELQREHSAVTEARLKLSVDQELTTLVHHYGMSWSDIARASGVTQQAIRKWRQNGKPSAESRTRLAQLSACLTLIDNAEVSDPAAWLELPIVPEHTPRRMDLFLGGKYYELVALARGDIPPDDAIASLDRNWREVFRVRNEVFLDIDGQLSIKPR